MRTAFSPSGSECRWHCPGAPMGFAAKPEALMSRRGPRMFSTVSPTSPQALVARCSFSPVKDTGMRFAESSPARLSLYATAKTRPSPAFLRSGVGSRGFCACFVSIFTGRGRGCRVARHANRWRMLEKRTMIRSSRLQIENIKVSVLKSYCSSCKLMELV